MWRRHRLSVRRRGIMPMCIQRGTEQAASGPFRTAGTRAYDERVGEREAAATRAYA